jgi:hypothetical protein
MSEESYCEDCKKYTRDIHQSIWVTCPLCGAVKRYKDEVKDVRK